MESLTKALEIFDEASDFKSHQNHARLEEDVFFESGFNVFFLIFLTPLQEYNLGFCLINNPVKLNSMPTLPLCDLQLFL